MRKSIAKQRSEVKEDLTSVRLVEKSIKRKSKVMLGDETEATMPSDMEFLFASKLLNRFLVEQVSASNMMFGLTRAYLEKNANLSEEELKTLEKSLNAKLQPLTDLYVSGFAKFKVYVSKMIEKHPLWLRLKGIKGFTAYQLGAIMALIKDIKKFENHSNLMVYSGLASIDGIPINKANLEAIKKIYQTKFGKEFKGFNTLFSGRMFVISECLLRAGGYFYHLYNRFRKAIEERAINQKQCFLATEKDVEDSRKIDGKKKGKAMMVVGEYYMFNKKNQSLRSFSHTNARRRICRVLLYLIWKEWRELEGLPAREPYVAEYLGHGNIITIEEVRFADSKAIKEAPEADENIADAV